MAACRLFDEDEVCLITPDKGYVYGLVLENAEFISSDEEGDDLPGQITKGSVRVAWHPDGKETVVEENKIMLADRSLMPGDVMRHMDENEDSQAGFVEDTTVTCHLHVLGTDKYIYNVNSKHLIYPKYDTDPGDVTLDSWLGKVDAVNEEYVLQFPDGARCVVSDDICAFEDVIDKRYRHTEFCNEESYPSQELKGIMGDLADSKWLVETPAYNAGIVKSKPKMNVHVTVAEVRIVSVDVHWLCRGLSKVENPLDNTETPPRRVSGDLLSRLHSLNWFEHCSVQIGDKVQYVLPDTSVLVPVPPRQHAKPLHVDETVELSPNDRGQPENPDPVPSAEAVCDPVAKPDTDCKCNDDGYEDTDDTSSDSSEAGSLGSNRSEGGTRKRKNAKKGPHLATMSMKKVKGRRAKKKFNFPERVLQAGDTVTVEICYTFSKASIRWQDASQSIDVPSTKLYPIHHLDSLEFFPGDFVSDTRENQEGDYGVVVSSNHKDRTCVVKWMKMYEVGKGSRPTCILGPSEISVYDIVDHQEYKYRTGYIVIRVGGFKSRDEELPAVGQVYNLDNNGTIDVKWADGRLTTCYPQDLYVSSDILEDFSDSELDSSDSSSDDEDDEEESDASWETEDEEDVLDIEEAFKESEAPAEKTGIPFLNKEQNADVQSLMTELPAELANLETVFEFLKEGTPTLTTQYRAILQIYSSCKYLDKMVKTSFFKDEELTDLIAIIKSERKREKYKKISSRFQSLYQSWYNNVSNLGCQRRLSEPGDEAFAQSLIEEAVRKSLVEESNSKVSDRLGINRKPSEDQAVAKLSEEHGITEPSGVAKAADSPGVNRPSEAQDASKPSGVEVMANPSGDQAISRPVVEEASCKPSGDQECCASLKNPDCCVSSKSDPSQAKNETSDLASPSRISKSLMDESGDCCENVVQCDAVACSLPQNILSPTQDGREGKQTMGSSPNSGMPDYSNAELCFNVLKKLHHGLVKLQNEVNKYRTTSEIMLEQEALNRVEIGTQTEASVSDIMLENGEIDGAHLCGSATVKSESGHSVDAQLTSVKSENEHAQISEFPGVKSENGDVKETERHESSGGQIENGEVMETELSSSECEKEAVESSGLERPLFCDKGSQTQDVNRTGGLCSRVSEEHSQCEDTGVCDEIECQPGSDDVPTENGASPVMDSQDCDEDSSVVKGFELMEEALLCHRFHSNEHISSTPKAFNMAVSRELKLLKTSLPSGILVKSFTDRLDLYSIMIVGPKKTPYEDGLFFFDVQLPSDYPSSPPIFHYHSFCVDRLNPNLYDDGKVCVSLLGTWAGKGNEVWTAKSNLLQVLISIQGLILVSEPYYNEAGYEKQRGTPQAVENSRMYNEMAILKLIQSLTNMAKKPPKIFEKETWKHLVTFGPRIIKQLEAWMKLSDLKSRAEASSASKTSDDACPNSINAPEHAHQNHVPGLTCETQRSDHTNTACAAVEQDTIAEPEFPLLPVSKGFRLTLKKELARFRSALEQIEPRTV